ncbi:hypothetical protein ACTJNK_21645 [Achromobacter anxifer]
MELISITADVQPAPSEFHRARIFTNQMIGRLQDSNSAARALRTAGYRILDEDAAPEDGGKPILMVDLQGRDAEGLLNQCDASTRHTAGRITALYQGVRLIVQGAAC